jgi:hypothetical protein
LRISTRGDKLIYQKLYKLKLKLQLISGVTSAEIAHKIMSYTFYVCVTHTSNIVCQVEEKMPLFFLVPLCAGLFSGYICKRYHDDIGQLAGVVAAISLIISLVLAPWEVQLLLLILVLIATPKFLWKNDDKVNSSINQSHTPELNHRDNQTVISPPSNGSSHILTMKYRGIPLHKISNE